MKNKTWLYIIIGVVILIVLIVIVVKISGTKCDPRKTGYDINGKLNSDCGIISPDYGNNNNNNNNNNNPNPTPNVTPKSPIDSHIGQWIKAKYDGTTLYDNDLNIIKTYYAGEDIGRLGEEAINYSCCTNQKGFYKVYETTLTSGFCGCEPLLSDSTLKSIFNIS